MLLSGKYGYDPGGQLTGAAYEVANPTVPNVPNDAFAYDNAGNRTTVNGTSYTLNSAGLNQYAAAGSYGAASYDARGNLVALGVGASAIYDAQNEMTSGSVNGNSVSFAYDALGRCVKRIVNGAASYFYYDGWSLIEEDNSAGAAQLLYVYGPATDELAAIYSASSSSWSWYHYDARGSVTHLTNASGQVVEQYSYSAFGIPSYFSSTGQLLNSSTVGNRFLFQGRDWIKELGVYEYRNRMYHPGIGRFLQPDPLSLDAGDQNIYRYCNNDPINGSDPLGLGDPISIGTLTYGDGSLYSASSEAYYNAIFGSAPSSTSIFSFTSSSNFGFGSSFGDLQSLFRQLFRGGGYVATAANAVGGGNIPGTGIPNGATPIPNPNTKSFANIIWGGETPVNNTNTRAELQVRFKADAATIPNFSDATLDTYSGKPRVNATITATKFLPRDVLPNRYTELDAIESKSVRILQKSTGDTGARMSELVRDIRDAETARAIVVKELKEAFRQAWIRNGKVNADIMGGNSHPGEKQ